VTKFCAPKFRRDLTATPRRNGATRYFEIHDPLSGATLRFSAVGFSIACLIDGRRSFVELRQCIADELDLQMSEAKLRQLIERLDAMGCLEGEATATVAYDAKMTVPLPVLASNDGGDATELDDLVTAYYPHLDEEAADPSTPSAQVTSPMPVVASAAGGRAEPTARVSLDEARRCTKRSKAKPPPIPAQAMKKREMPLPPSPSPAQIPSAAAMAPSPWPVAPQMPSPPRVAPAYPAAAAAMQVPAPQPAPYAPYAHPYGPAMPAPDQRTMLTRRASGLASPHAMWMALTFFVAASVWAGWAVMRLV
jgi:hypothetical protein